MLKLLLLFAALLLLTGCPGGSNVGCGGVENTGTVTGPTTINANCAGSTGSTSGSSGGGGGTFQGAGGSNQGNNQPVTNKNSNNVTNPPPAAP